MNIMDDNINVEIMQPSAFTDLSREIIQANGDQGKITALLTQLQDGYAALFATHASVSKENETLTGENQKLKEYNLELFMQHGESLRHNREGSKEEPKGDERAKTIKVSDLFKPKE